MKNLEILAEQISSCELCQELTEFRKCNSYQTVPGYGNPSASIMLIGEAPGENEAQQGLPFVGKAGRMLDGVLETAGFNRNELFVANILKCRPPANRQPKEDEVKNCIKYLNKQVNLINPKYIVCLGKTAAYYVLNTKEPIEKFKIGQVRKKIFRSGNKKIICTYHPSYLLRLPAAKYDVLDDLKMLKNEMDSDLIIA